MLGMGSRARIDIGTAERPCGTFPHHMCKMSRSRAGEGSRRAAKCSKSAASGTCETMHRLATGDQYATQSSIARTTRVASGR